MDSELKKKITDEIEGAIEDLDRIGMDTGGEGSAFLAERATERLKKAIELLNV